MHGAEFRLAIAFDLFFHKVLIRNIHCIHSICFIFRLSEEKPFFVVFILYKTCFSLYYNENISKKLKNMENSKRLVGQLVRSFVESTY